MFCFRGFCEMHGAVSFWGIAFVKLPGGFILRGVVAPGVFHLGVLLENSPWIVLNLGMVFRTCLFWELFQDARTFHCALIFSPYPSRSCIKKYFNSYNSWKVMIS